MMVLITYDVNTNSELGTKRLRKVAKQCVNYGQRVQNSVFECSLTPAQLVNLKKKLLDIIDEENDSIRFYNLGKNWQNRVEILGKDDSYDPDKDLLII
ncbi:MULTISPECIES: CRISPR-associated endonuclease Cas2 [Anaerococcus]|uniref:CRISPR-associated endoribonuclease Cas2 n=1 Tax=Anaerococcus octavius TaxID=54007 RepID=A0A2I1M4Y9_9FIRM|nr:MULTISPECIES: CRISPR-associated endonuclease Cas2 [Anaerococcus]MBS6106880.1 CRISPR-associated endonuclease Cas2 [Anaerococcus sp.]PKZ15164.1 CRISPR-associated endonuclease Cas2 [Anaerococcus octavius]